MRRLLLVLCFVSIALTACDFLTAGEGGTSPAQDALHAVAPYVPPGPWQIGLTAGNAILAVVASIMARRGAAKQHAATESREYNADEAVSMAKALEAIGFEVKRKPVP